MPIARNYVIKSNTKFEKVKSCNTGIDLIENHQKFTIILLLKPLSRAHSSQLFFH